MKKDAVDNKAKEKDAAHWEGPVTIENTGSEKNVYRILRWVAKAASKDETHVPLLGMYSDVVDDARVFVCTDGEHLHMVSVEPGPYSALLHNIPVGKILAFPFRPTKGITFTEEIKGTFPDYRKVIPDISKVEPLSFWLNKDSDNTEALYALYHAGIKVSVRHVAALSGAWLDSWNVYHTDKRVVFRCVSPWVEYTSICAPWSI
jgi:hypothetical protein